jgi:hypothetical protein
MTEPRTIALARTFDGTVVHEFGFSVNGFGSEVTPGCCAADPADFVEGARRLWAAWAPYVTLGRICGLVAETGAVVDGTRNCRYRMVRVGATILDPRPSASRAFAGTREMRWMDTSPDAAIVLGPSAVLALAAFAVDAATISIPEHRWPFAPFLSVCDTGSSPYPPQNRSGGDPIELGPTELGGRADPDFVVYQRSERWLQPLDSVYGVFRRNLIVRCTRAARPATESIVLDGLTAEDEPTLDRSNWIATWHSDSQSGRHWGFESLAVMLPPAPMLHLVLGAVGAPTTGCVCDSIEGDTFGIAPALEISRSSIELKALGL